MVFRDFERVARVELQREREFLDRRLGLRRAGRIGDGLVGAGGLAVGELIGLQRARQRFRIVLEDDDVRDRHDHRRAELHQRAAQEHGAGGKAAAAHDFLRRFSSAMPASGFAASSGLLFIAALRCTSPAPVEFVARTCTSRRRCARSAAGRARPRGREGGGSPRCCGVVAAVAEVDVAPGGEGMRMLGARAAAADSLSLWSAHGAEVGAEGRLEPRALRRGQRHAARRDRYRRGRCRRQRVREIALAAHRPVGGAGSPATSSPVSAGPMATWFRP